MPEPVLISIAAALAGRAVIKLYTLVRDKFADNPEVTAVLEAAEGAAEDSQQVRDLATVLEKTETADPAFSEHLREEWAVVSVDQRAEFGGVNNSVTGQVGGNVVQARDIQGNISL